jgi:formamidopyrimidine-DNA glycosylase
LPEIPDIEAYLAALTTRIEGSELQRIRLASPFLLRSVNPPLAAVNGRQVESLERLGKRLVFVLEDNLFLVLHLMVAGRLRWATPGATVPKRSGLAAFDFASGSLVLTEAGSKKRASLFLVEGRPALQEHDPGGLEVLEADLESFAAAIQRENHTLKRTLTDPHILSGIGNAYSDEILHHARFSPFQQTVHLTADEIARLYRSTREVLSLWIERLRNETGENFPSKVTAFRPDMAVHGRYGLPCPECGTAVQRIIYATNEANYCPRCQTEGRLLADRVLSRLLKNDWPRTLEELEERPSGRARYDG